jgi:hypothetical protein
MSNTKKSRSQGKCLLYLLCAAIVFRTKWLEGYTSWTRRVSGAMPEKSTTEIKRSSASKEIRKSQKV